MNRITTDAKNPTPRVAPTPEAWDFLIDKEKNMSERRFSGVFIPVDVYLDERLTAVEKIVFAEIDSLDDEERGCFASNEYLADFCKCSIRKVSESVAKLIDCGYIYQESFNGRTRVLRSRLAESARQTSKKCETDEDIHINKDNNIDYNKQARNAQKEESKKSYGVFENVMLTDDELQKLKQKFTSDWQSKIDNLSEYIASKGKKYKSHYATILVWDRKNNGGKSSEEKEYF